MNAQRWIALGILAVAIGLCVVISLSRQATVTLDSEESMTLIPTTTPTPAPAMTETITPSPTLLLFVGEGTPTPIGDEPYIILSGDFGVIDSTHRGEGQAFIYQVGDTRRVLRLDPFQVTAGPELRVLLSPHPEPRTSAEVMLPTYVDMGALVSTTGAQNYEIPPDVNLREFRSVVIYSTPFNIIYTTATLEEIRGQ